MILQRLVGVAKPYWEYFRFRAENHSLIFSRLFDLYHISYMVFGPQPGVFPVGLRDRDESFRITHWLF